MMKKLFVSILTIATVLGSTTTVGLANGVVKETSFKIGSSEKENPFGTNSRQSVWGAVETAKTPLEKLSEEKSLLSTRLFSTEFPTLPISEQLSLLNHSFSLQQSIHGEYKTLLLSSNMTDDLDHLRETLQIEQRNMEKEIQLFEQILSLTKTDKKEEMVASKKELTNALKSLQTFRSSGRELRDMLSVKEKTLQASQIGVLQQVFTSSIEENQIEQAIDSLAKIVKLSEGDQDYVTFLHDLLKEDQSYLLWNNELLPLTDGFVKSEDHFYVSVEELKKWMDVSLNTDKEKKEVLTIGHLEHQALLDSKGVTFDGVSIGNPLVWKKDKSNKQYVDAEFIFELFGYQVTTDSNKKIMSVNKEIYPIEEMDELSVEDIVDSIFQ